jgi:hypothetical protein
MKAQLITPGPKNCHQNMKKNLQHSELKQINPDGKECNVGYFSCYKLLSTIVLPSLHKLFHTKLLFIYIYGYQSL